MEEPMNWGWVAAFVALGWNIINTIYTWHASAQSVTKDEVRKLMGETGILGNRLTKIESELNALPSAAQFHELDKKVTEVSGAIRTMEAEFKPTALSVKRIEDFLINSRVSVASKTRR